MVPFIQTERELHTYILLKLYAVVSLQFLNSGKRSFVASIIRGYYLCAQKKKKM